MNCFAIRLGIGVCMSLIFAYGSAAPFVRQHYAINAAPWKFKKQDVSNAQEIAFDDAAWQTVSIPHDFNGGIDKVNNDVFKGPSMYRGTGWYRTHFTIGDSLSARKVFVEFEAVSLVSDVYVNGRHLGRHKGGYTPFSYDISQYVNFGGDNVLAVKANSANDNTVAPWMRKPFDWFPNCSDYAVYGGIYRDVWITITGTAKIERTRVTTPQVSAASATVRVRTEVHNYGTARATVSLKTEIVDSNKVVVKTMSAEQAVAAGQTFTFDQTSEAIAGPHLWSPEAPYVYTVRSTLESGGQASDQYESPLGFRWFVLKNGQGFTFNGATSLIRGTNRHQDRFGYGYALTNEQHRQDARAIKSLGVNFVRHAHYPSDPEFLTACDKLGLMVWLEIPTSTCISNDTAFLESSKSQLKEMIRSSYNHPSVVIWGLGNESDHSDASSESYLNGFFSQLNALAHAEDSSRPTTGCNWRYPSNQRIVDVYSPQEWTGWYSGGHGDWAKYNPTELIGEYGADMVLDSNCEYGVEKMWSQQYGCLLHEYKAAKGESLFGKFPGACTWVAFDFASPRIDRATNPTPYMNQKGLFMADHTTPKDVAYFYRSLFTDKLSSPMVYIVSHTWLDRWTKPSKKMLWCYSNCDSVELFNDYGTLSLGKRARTAGALGRTRFQWDDANVQYNILYAEGRVAGKVVVRDTIRLKNLPDPPHTANAPQPTEEGGPEFVVFAAGTGRGVEAELILRRPSIVRLNVFSLLGEKIAGRANERLPAGIHRFTIKKKSQAKGMMFVRLEAGGTTFVRKVIMR